MTTLPDGQGDEQFVREHWELVHRCDGSYRHYQKGAVLLQEERNHWSEFESWAAARAFTEARLEEIRQVEEEIILLRSMVILLTSEPTDQTAPIYKRTIVRLSSIRAELKRGLKEKPAASQESHKEQ